MTDQQQIQKAIADMDAAMELYYSAKRRLESLVKPASPKRLILDQQWARIEANRFRTAFKNQQQ